MEFTLEALETPALTKAQLADLLFEQIGLNKRESKDMVEAFFDLIADSLIEGTDVKISGFGNFQIRVKAPRPGPQSAHRRGDPDRRAPRRHLPRQRQAQGTDPRQHRRRRRRKRSSGASAPNKCLVLRAVRGVTSEVSLAPP